MPHLHLGEAHTRALAAMLRYLHGPVLFEAFNLPAAIHLPPLRLVVAAGGQSVPLDHQQLKAIARRERVDVVGISVDAWRELHPILFDIFLHRPDGVTHLPACRLFADTGAAMFLPRLATDEAVLDRDGRARPHHPAAEPGHPARRDRPRAG